MGRKTAFALSLAALTLFAAPSNLFAQCTWCKTVTDVCCDGNYTVAEDTLPCALTSIYIYYDAPRDDRVHALIYDVSGGGEMLIAELNDDGEDCDCARELIFSDPINAGHVLRFKIECRKCKNDQTSCDAGSVSVKFFTPSTNTCAPNCTGS